MTSPTVDPAAKPPQLLHWVIKVGNLRRSLAFYQQVLGMHILRHEEFSSGCDAQCNGPYARPWSKTMVGYGSSEADSFVLELTYNYGIRKYERGNDLDAVLIHAPRGVVDRARTLGWPIESEQGDGTTRIKCPDGHSFEIVTSGGVDEPVCRGVRLNVANLAASADYYTRTLGLTKTKTTTSDTCRLVGGSSEPQKEIIWLELKQIDTPIEHAKAYGRLAIAVPTAHLPSLEKAASSSGTGVHTPLVRLETPGKATVQVVIVRDVDGNEVCLVGGEEFMELASGDVAVSEVDWESRRDNGATETDKDAVISAEWFA